MLSEYENNKDLIENLETNVQEKKQKEKSCSELYNKLNECEEKIIGLVKVCGSLEQKIKDLEEKKIALEEKKKVEKELQWYMNRM
jgi:phage shock protein A